MAQPRDELNDTPAANQLAAGTMRPEPQIDTQVQVAERSSRAGRKSALNAVRKFLEDKIRRLMKALTKEGERQEGVGQEVADNAKHRKELEAALTEYQEAKDMLPQDGEASQQQLHAQQKTSGVEQSRPKVWPQELQAVQADVLQRVKQLTETLAEETNRRQGAEQQIGEISQRRSELQARLAENKQAQEQLRQELQAAQKQLQARQESSSAEQSKLETRVRDLQAAHEEIEQKVKSLTEKFS